MKLLLGVYGQNAMKYLDFFEQNVNQYEKVSADFLIVNNNEGRIKYPPHISGHGKTLFLNGFFILKDYTLDDFLNNHTQILRSILKKDVVDIAKEFVNGAFNGAILSNHSFYIFNDFMALYPLYYAFHDSNLFFSTNLQLLAKMLKPTWNSEALVELLQVGYNFTYNTLLRGIFCMPPSSLLCYNDSGFSLTHYASFPECEEIIMPQHEVIEKVHENLKTSIKRLYSPKLKYSLSLTGGMDSRIIFLEWLNRRELLTETAGENTSDYIIACQLVEKFGNTSLHELEDKKDDLYLDGIEKYYDMCDNPTKLSTHYNYYHLIWKQDRGADIHLSGVGGELFNGENLYLNRNSFYVLKEAILPYSYHRLDDDSKSTLLKRVVYAASKNVLLKFINTDYVINDNDIIESIAKKLNTFLGKPSFKETYVERFRTLMLANFAYYPLSVVANFNDLPVSPYNDREFVQGICRYHPVTRELRRLELSILRKYKYAMDIPIDTTHLKPFYPYALHKFFRVLRMVLNIGFHRKIPIIQKGEPPKFRASKYFDHTRQDYRQYVNSCILNCSFYDKEKVKGYLKKIEKLSQTNFYTVHNEMANISILFRLAIAEKKFK